MATGTVTFMAPVTGLQLDSIEISYSLPTVEKLSLETQEGGWIKIDFHLSNMFAIEDAEDIAKPILRSIIDRLAFELDVSIGEPYLRGATLPKDPSASVYTTTASLPVSWRVLAPDVIPDATRRREIAMLLEQPFSRPDLYSAYRFALNQSDAVARYMFLYNILLQLHSDAQRQVDDFIRQEEPNVPQSPNPLNANVMETVYTRLRNEIGHTRAGTTPEQTRSEMEDHIAALQTLVKTAISRVV
jgi:hypothetical protein